MWIEAKFEIKDIPLDDFEGVLLINGIESWERVEENNIEEIEKNFDYIDSSLLVTQNPCIKVVLEYNDENHSLLDRISEQTGAKAQIRLQDEKEWSEEWKKYYKPMEIGKRLCICPVWADYTGTERIVCRIEPGNVFGTGLHQTTQLCLEFLDEIIVGGETVLDLGSGSGILGISSLLLGAKKAVGTDIEPSAQNVASQNARINGKEDSFQMIIGNIVENPDFLPDCNGGYDVIIANIVADVIAELTPLITDLFKQKGFFFFL